MIKIHHFNEGYQYHQQHKINFRLLQDMAAVLIGICQTPRSPVSNALEITQADIDWLTQQTEAALDYSDYLGGCVYICETEQDLLQIQGCDFEWAKQHDGHWPNVTDIPLSFDACYYLEEAFGDPQWVLFIACWNNAGGPTYYVPKRLWVQARVTEHIEATN